MKLAIILTILFITFTNCDTRSGSDKRNSQLQEFYTAYMVGDLYVRKNICPPAKIFDPGTYDISLEQGEALYFDISPRSNPGLDGWRYGYLIGISNDIASLDIAMNSISGCYVNFTITKPTPMQTASNSSYSIENTDAQFNYYYYSLSRIQEVVLTAKAINNPIQFKLKIPENGTR